MRNSKLTMLAAALLTVAGVANAQDNGALLDLLVKKHVISDQEAEQVRADLEKEYAHTSAGKLNVGAWVQEMKIGGDLRMRYQYDNRDFQVDPPRVGGDKDGSPSGSQRSRWRFRLRIRDEFKLANNWFGGIELSTGQASDSGNQTFGDSTGGSGFSKYGIFISKAYLGWNAGDWGTVVGGKQPNPFYSTELVWDPDINPDGLTETIRFHKMYFGGGASEGYSKDGKSIATPSIQEERPWELTLNLGQFIFTDNLENGGIATEPGFTDNDISNDAYLFVGQLVASYKTQAAKFTIAPGVMFFNAATVFGVNNENVFQDGTALPGGAVPRGTSFIGATRKEIILTAPGDVSFKLGSIPSKFYWDFAYNTDGKGRADDIYGVLSVRPDGTVRSKHLSEDDFAFLVGLQLGENKKAGDWSVLANYRQTGLTSVDPNLNDSDFALGELNTRGFKVGLLYNLTDFATIGTSYMYAWNLRDHLFGGAAAGVGTGVADANVVQVLQVDLNLKF